MSSDSLVSVQKWVIHNQPIAETGGLLLEGWIEWLAIEGLERRGKRGIQQGLISQAR